MDTELEIARYLAVGPYTIDLAVGDVAEVAGAVPVVSSDDNYLSHGGGVSAAIWRRVGDALAQDPAVLAVTERGERPGLAHVLVSWVGRPRVPVFHAITVDFDLGERLSPRDLGLLYTNLLNAADENGVEEIVLPLAGAGAGQVGAVSTVTALLDVARSRSMLSNGQRLSIRVLPHDLADSVGAVDEWVHRHPDSIQPGEIQSLRIHADQIQSDQIDRAVAALVPTLVGHPGDPWDDAAGARRSDGSVRRQQGRWEELARDAARGPEIVAAARELDEAPNSRASGPAIRLWGLLERDAGAWSAPPPGMDQIVEIARSARNRIAHGKGDQTPLLPDLLRGIEVLLDPQSAALTVPHSADVLVGGVRLDWSSDGTQHVRLLHDLLRTSLTAPQIEAESDRLAALGYRGTPTDMLLENCVTDDPLDVLQRHFSGSALRALLDERDIPARPSDPPRELARKLLHQLGFPRRDDLVDPEMVLRDVTILASELHTLSEAQLTGRIAGISRGLEAVLRTYLRFLTIGLLDLPPDRWLGQRREDRPGDRLPPSVDRATFGQLAVLVGAAGKQINRSTDPRTQARVDDLRDDSGTVKWLPDRIDGLIKQRNVWVHGASDAGERSLTVTEKRKQARDFSKLASDILTSLVNGPFPTVIVIEEIGYDTWGRRHVRARTSKGTVESIFTDLDLVPGQTYLMHARTNPLRVDPLLVRQAGAIDEDDL